MADRRPTRREATARPGTTRSSRPSPAPRHGRRLRRHLHGRCSRRSSPRSTPRRRSRPQPRYHGRHQLNRHPDGLEKCIGCELCAWACPADAIYVEGADNTDEERFSPGRAVRPRLPDQLPALHLLRPVHRGLPDPGADDDERVRAGRPQPGRADLREAGPARAAAARACSPRRTRWSRAPRRRTTTAARSPRPSPSSRPGCDARRRARPDGRTGAARRARRSVERGGPAAVRPVGAVLAAGRRDMGGGEAVLFWVLAPIMVLGALGLLFAKKAVHAALCMALVMISLGIVYFAAAGAVPRRRADLRLHRRRDDAVPLRPDAGRRRLLRLAGRDDQGPAGRGRRCSGSASRVLLLIGVLGARRPSPPPAGPDGRSTRSGNITALAALIFGQLRLGLRGHRRAADHRGAGRDGAGPPRAARPAADPARAVDAADQGRRRSRRRCPPPACSPGTTRSTPRPCCPTARRASCRSRGCSRPAARCARRRASVGRGRDDRRPRSSDPLGDDEHGRRPARHAPDGPTAPDRGGDGGEPRTGGCTCRPCSSRSARATVLVRRNAIIVFMGVELMLNATNLAFVTFARMQRQPRRPGHRAVRDARRRRRGRRRAGHHHDDLPHPPVGLGRRRQPAEVLRGGPVTPPASLATAHRREGGRARRLRGRQRRLQTGAWLLVALPAARRRRAAARRPPHRPLGALARRGAVLGRVRLGRAAVPRPARPGRPSSAPATCTCSTGCRPASFQARAPGCCSTRCRWRSCCW